LPYYSTTFAGDGFALIGDASAFIDPFYSPGMDWVSFTCWSSVQIVLAQLRGEDIKPMLERHNRDFSRSYARWFSAVYKDKYEYMGDYDLMRLAFQMDLGMYYIGVASQPFRRGTEALAEPVFSTGPSVPFFYWMRLYNRRFAQIARARRRRGVWGKSNDCRRCLVPGFTFSPKSSWPVVKSLVGWFWIELTEGWRTWFVSDTKSQPAGQAVSPAPQGAP
jgi:hypothetical protein